MNEIPWGLLTVAAIIPPLILGVYCAIMAIVAVRPQWGEVPMLTWAIWHAGQIFVWSCLLLLAGGVFGIAARGAWKLVGF